MCNEKLINKPEVQVLLQQLSNDRSPATNTYKEIIYLLDEITEKLIRIDATLDQLKNDDPNTQTPQQTGMSAGRCPI